MINYSTDTNVITTNFVNIIIVLVPIPNIFTTSILRCLIFITINFM